MEDTAESRLGSSESPIMNFKVGLALALGYVALVAAFWLGRYLLWSRKPSLRLKLPPGPKGVPVFGSLFKVFNDRTKLPHQVLFDLSKEYGPTMSLRLGSRYAVHISTPGLAREVFKNHDRNFANRPYHSSKDLLLHSTGTIGYSLYNEHLKNIRYASWARIHMYAMTSAFGQRHAAAVLNKSCKQRGRSETSLLVYRGHWAFEMSIHKRAHQVLFSIAW